MSETLTFTIAILLIAGSVWLYFNVQRYRRGKVINEIASGMNLLGKWTYTTNEWRKAVEEEFDWASSNDSPGQVFISPTSIYVRTNAHEHLIDLAENDKVVTHASYRGTDDSPLKLRVRWKVVDYDSDNRHTRYYKEDYRIPVPSEAKDAARNVVDFFSKQMESNPDAYARVVSDDEPISLFGNDSY